MKKISFHFVFMWFARLASIASIVVLSLFLFGAAEEQQLSGSSELLGFACFPIGVVIGFLVSWKWERAGAIVSILSLVAFYEWHLFNSGVRPSGPWFIIFTSPAFIFLFTALFARK